MNKTGFIGIISVVITLISFLYACSYNRNDFVAKEVKYFDLEDSIPIRQYVEYRESITFILGEDKEADNPYYTEATDFYRFNATERTEYVVVNCRSLTEVQEYLHNNLPYSGTPWGLINLVTHGNQWVGMSVAVHPELKRATASKIRKSIEEGYFTGFSDSIIDNKTKIFIHGCGIGNNYDLVKAVGEIFSGKLTKPLIRASKLYEYYTSVRNGNVLIESQRYMAKVYFAFYKMGYKPERSVLINEFSEKYPNAKINWEEVIERDVPRWQGDPYYYTFEVPLKWTKKYLKHDSLPDLSNEDKKIAWVKSQKALVETVGRTDIPIEKFNWWIRTIHYKNRDGNKLPALWVKGYATVFCIVKPLLSSNKDSSQFIRPFIPSVGDTLFFNIVNKQLSDINYQSPMAHLILHTLDIMESRIREE